jgi:hypothetical protein
MDVHMDDTYVLFWHFLALPSVSNGNRQEVAPVRGVLALLLPIIQHRAAYMGALTDHDVEALRNGL